MGIVECWEGGCGVGGWKVEIGVTLANQLLFFADDHFHSITLLDRLNHTLHECKRS